MKGIATDVLTKNKNNTTKFDNLALVDNGLVLKDGKKQLGQISFSEIEKIYIKVYKLKPIYGFLFVMIPVFFAFLCFEFIKLNVEMAMVILPVKPALEKRNRFKSYGLVIVLKDGSVYSKKLPLKFKTDTIEIINEVKRKMVVHK